VFRIVIGIQILVIFPKFERLIPIKMFEEDVRERDRERGWSELIDELG